ncbi:uncharacterized alpha-1,2-galactosyltransferase C1289.13c-like [Physcomitrium patens]|uniref:Uncharacterized protein n=1 Tax=Physcomitrium patens TaxID=3218 RepID=A0A2K1JVH2_PHYPA|nr:uncharacterized alpha-1,2-galactosyltransferase C1289.13c-like [Physcomitrium patens]XP_024389533.1 uncharacterized alpha-1,2-galactosyltransferase C1289.13c-like [Physcomitrium patens]XP_024389534.1 uncharacterized alpha-1,2-galactosyltransferase C1289.13c-like [Physcomitrium patens]XP_024389535.1 uncharacterized alpha-1,2-galactosyltransferase C1289.13c-like [Physcomitrium patens]XP_024389536.1 uncharacterized alpha-1,2-galactosyltransferase C1289.13c-like [Physcomitrium patens]XP_0243895|eukprot:XP_024389532.1 uncharacterized alpha-1,2-galactosyltransferase C1289.13c-like [Physcomitrella patens]
MAEGTGISPQRRFKGMYSECAARLRSRESFKKEASFRHYWSTVQSISRAILVLICVILVICALGFSSTSIILRNANDFGRQCLPKRGNTPAYFQLLNFAMVTCSDGSSTIPGRSFEGVMEIVAPNKEAYVERHGYDFIDASSLLDSSRPPSWSKILAVKEHLSQYDWLFWNDADSAVTNPDIKLGDIVFSAVGDVKPEEMPDFIVTEDVTGVNAGMFFFRNSDWSREFLDRWWNQTEFIQPFGQSKSGDNTALKYLLNVMDKGEFSRHVRIPDMQCLFNSNLWRPSWRSCHRLVTLTKAVWRGVYARGDFMVHLAGLNDKSRWMRNVLFEADSWRKQLNLNERVQTAHGISSFRKKLSSALSA